MQSEWKPCNRECPKCGAYEVEYQLVESYDEAYEDSHYHCKNCNYSWWVDGIDS